MKKTITYREITIAIGILVAMVIALTFWSRSPGQQQVTGSDSSLNTSLPATAQYLFPAAVKMFETPPAFELGGERY